MSDGAYQQYAHHVTPFIGHITELITCRSACVDLRCISPSLVCVTYSYCAFVAVMV